MTNNCKHNEENLCDHPQGRRYFHFDKEKMMCECGDVIEEYVKVDEVENIIELHKHEYDDKGVDDILNDVLREVRVKFTNNNQNE